MAVTSEQERVASDIDLLVDPAPGTDLFQLPALCSELRELLGAPVDVVPAGPLDPWTAAAVMADARPL